MKNEKVETGEETHNYIVLDSLIQPAQELENALKKITTAGKNKILNSGDPDRWNYIEAILNGTGTGSGKSLVSYLKVGKLEMTESQFKSIIQSNYSVSTGINVIRDLKNWEGSDNVSSGTYVNITQNEIDKLSTNLTNVHFVQTYNNSYTEEGTNLNLSTKTETNKTYTELKSTAGQLQGIVSGWYYTLRNLALIALLSILVYIGIRIVISSTANEKAKYKSMIMDWVIAMCLLFFLHYIMAFSVTIVKRITDAVSSIDNGAPEIVRIQDEDTFKQVKESKFKDYVVDKNDDGNYTEGSDYVAWPIGNFTEYARLELQLLAVDGDQGYDSMASMTYSIVYIILIIYTVIFSFTYAKRVVYMAFLTLIAPLVALTYPIDKLNDGKAQAFDTWLKEYIFNLLIQPMHLIIYTILIGAVYAFATENMLYTLVALGFMTPAEKLLRRFFGFEKAQTPGAFGGAAGTALMMTGMQRLLHRPPHGDREEEGRNKQSNDTNKKPKFAPGFDEDDVLTGRSTTSGISDTSTRALPTSSSTDTEQGGQDSQIRLSSQNNNSMPGNTAQDTDLSLDTPSPDLFRYNSMPEQTGTQGLDTNSLNREASDVVNKDRKEAQRKALSNEKGKENKKPIALKRGIRNMARTYGKNIRESSRRRHPGRKLRKAATFAVGGAAIGTLGLAAGIASGDPSKALQYGVTGAALGGQFTRGVGDKVASERKQLTQGGLTGFKEGYHGENYELDKYIKDKKRSMDTDDFLYNQGLSRQQRKDFREYYLPNYIKDGGLTDIEDMYTAYELETKEGYKQDEAMAAVKMANRWGDISSTPDLEKKWRDNYTSKIAEYDTTKQDAQRMANAELAQNEELQKLQKEQQAAEKKMAEAKKEMDDNKDGKKEELQKRYDAQRENYEKRRQAYENKNTTEYSKAYEKYRQTIARNTTQGLVDRVKKVNDLKRYHK